jgi:O-antigen/teichoic acid export membrane protein
MIGQWANRFGVSLHGRRFLETAAWSLLGEGLSRGLMLLAMVLVARMLGPHGYGEFGLVRTTVMMIASFGGMGLGLMANKFVAQHRESDKEFSSQIIGASYLIAIVAGGALAISVFLSAEWIAVGYLRHESLAHSLKLASVVLLGWAINGAQIGVLQGLHAYRNMTVANLIQGAIAIVCLVGGAQQFGLDGAMWGFVIHAVASVVLFHAMIVRESRARGLHIATTNLGRVWPAFTSIGLPVALMSLAVAPFKWLSETLLVKDMGFAALGTFHAAMSIANILIAVASTLNAPLISLTAARSDGIADPKSRYLNLYGSWFCFVAMALPIVAFPQLAETVFGPEFRSPEFVSALVLLTLYCGLMNYYQGVMRLVTLGGSMWFGFLTNVVEGLSLFAGFLLLAKYGVVGLGVAYLSSYVIRIAISIPVLLKTGLVPPRLMLDPWFLATLIVIVLLAAWRMSTAS